MDGLSLQGVAGVSRAISSHDFESRENPVLPTMRRVPARVAEREVSAAKRANVPSWPT